MSAQLSKFDRIKKAVENGSDRITSIRGMAGSICLDALVSLKQLLDQAKAKGEISPTLHEQADDRLSVAGTLTKLAVDMDTACETMNAVTYASALKDIGIDLTCHLPPGLAKALSNGQDEPGESKPANKPSEPAQEEAKPFGFAAFVPKKGAC